MRIINLETVKLRQSVIVRPLGTLGTCGPVPGSDLMWQAVSLTHSQARYHTKIRAKWNAANPSLRAGSIDAPAIAGQ